MTLISKKTHCFNCDAGSMERVNLTAHPKSNKIRFAKYTCSSCGASSTIHLKGHEAGTVVYNANGRSWSL